MSRLETGQRPWRRPEEMTNGIRAAVRQVRPYNCNNNRNNIAFCTGSVFSGVFSTKVSRANVYTRPAVCRTIRWKLRISSTHKAHRRNWTNNALDNNIIILSCWIMSATVSVAGFATAVCTARRDELGRTFTDSEAPPVGRNDKASPPGIAVITMRPIGTRDRRNLNDVQQKKKN